MGVSEQLNHSKKKKKLGGKLDECSVCNIHYGTIRATKHVTKQGRTQQAAIVMLILHYHWTQMVK